VFFPILFLFPIVLLFMLTFIACFVKPFSIVFLCSIASCAFSLVKFRCMCEQNNEFSQNGPDLKTVKFK